MIDPKELRIGNLLHRTINNKTWEVQLELTDFYWWAAAGGEEQYDPIPITPEWLERLGFEVLGNSFVEGFLFLDDMGKYLQHPMGSLKMKYVHQVQNLYFALTGHELKLKDIERKAIAD